ncbi:erythromycin esterase type II [Podospora australis]|uniref:Erythromycin esterase type II n=1 Tax=Podospora australis TaxID=1536484 RepID=A0AAN6WVI7_9PEZI|nr:erythromycin esterase type II [Podospora australis]
MSAKEPSPPTTLDPTVHLFRQNLTPIPSVHENPLPLSKFFDPFGADPNTQVLLIGDASHGTSEFYKARAEITKHMITHHGFNIVAVEADWPDAEAVDRYVRHRPGPRASIGPEGRTRKEGRESAFIRFPTWMWRNLEVQGFTEWLRTWNKGTNPKTEGVGFYGMDLYSLGASMSAVVDYLETVDPKMAEVARRRYQRMRMWAEEPHEYGLEALNAGFKGCEKDVLKMLQDLQKKRLEYSAKNSDGEEFHGGEQNAKLVRGECWFLAEINGRVDIELTRVLLLPDAEEYYKVMYCGRDESWNLRDKHMFDTLSRIIKHRSEHVPTAKAIVWAHNSHVGDARASSMGWSRDELNIGQLCKEAFGDKALIIGISGNTGTVAAARRWDGDMQIMKVRPGLPNSYEELFHATGVPSFALDLRAGHCDPKLREALMKKRLERFIGVIYAPQTERQSHYSHAVLPEQFDGFVWFDETRHVGALEVHQPHTALEYDGTWPFGL